MVRKNKGLLHTALVSGLAMVTAACGSIDSKATQAAAASSSTNAAAAPQLPMPVATLGDTAMQQDNQKSPAVSQALKQIDQLNQQQQYEQSLKLTQQLLQEYPESPDLALMEGVLFNQLERTAEAEQVFVTLSEKHPELPEPLNNLAVIYVNRGDLNRAISTLQKAFETHPSYARVQSNLRTLYTTLASQAYNRALNLGSQAPAPVLASLDRIPSQQQNTPAQHVQHIAAAQPQAKIIRTGGQASSQTLTAQERASIQADVIRAVQAAPVATATADLAAAKQPATSSPTAVKANQPATPAKADIVVASKAPEPAQPAAKPVVVTKPAAAEKPASPVVVAKPAAKTPAKAATTVAKATPQAAPAVEAKHVDHRALLKAQVMGWAAAWSAKDVPAYLSFYTNDFRPANRMSNKRWKKQRQQRLTKPKKISVNVSGISIQLKNDKLANVSFTQRYRADSYRDKVIKTLTFKHIGGDWKIAAEVSRKVR